MPLEICAFFKVFFSFCFCPGKALSKYCKLHIFWVPLCLVMAVLDVTVKRLVGLVISVLQRMASALVLEAEGEGRMWSEGVVISAKTNRVRL